MECEEVTGFLVGDFGFDVWEGRQLGDLKVVEGERRRDSAGLAQGRDCVAGRAWTSLVYASNGKSATSHLENMLGNRDAAHSDGLNLPHSVHIIHLAVSTYPPSPSLGWS